MYNIRHCYNSPYSTHVTTTAMVTQSAGHRIVAQRRRHHTHSLLCTQVMIQSRSVQYSSITYRHYIFAHGVKLLAMPQPQPLRIPRQQTIKPSGHHTERAIGIVVSSSFSITYDSSAIVTTEEINVPCVCVVRQAQQHNINQQQLQSAAPASHQSMLRASPRTTCERGSH